MMRKSTKIGEIRRAHLIIKSLQSDLHMLNMILKENNMTIAERSAFIANENVAIMDKMVFDELSRLCHEEGQTIQAKPRTYSFKSE